MNMRYGLLFVFFCFFSLENVSMDDPTFTRKIYTIEDLLNAIRDEKKEEITQILDQASSLINVAGDVILHEHFNCEVMSILEENITALHLAAMIGNAELVEELVRRGANVSAKDKDEKTPLDRAAQQTRGLITGLEHYEQIVRVLFNAGASFKKTHNTLSLLEVAFHDDPVVRKKIDSLWPPQYKNAMYTSYPRY